MQGLYKEDFENEHINIDLPERITILGGGGAHDLEQKGISGYYTYVGYRHKGGRSESKMARTAIQVAYDVVAPALAYYAGVDEDDVNIDDFINSMDMVRVWVEVDE